MMRIRANDVRTGSTRTEPTHARTRPRRSAFTLIEMIAAMLSATILLVGLASTVAIATSLVDWSPESETPTLQLEIHDRLAGDLRYAVTLPAPGDDSFSLQRRDAISGTAQQIIYGMANEGLTRQVDLQPPASFHPARPTASHGLDEYQEPIVAGLADAVLWRSSSESASSSTTTSLSVTLPPGCAAGDLLLLSVAGKFVGMGITVSPGDWTVVTDTPQSTLRQVVLYRFVSSGDVSDVVLTTSAAAPLTGTLQCFSGVDSSSPIAFVGTATGYADPLLASTLPTALQRAEPNASGISVQCLASENDQWPTATLGLASFVDSVQSLAAPGVLSSTVAQGAALRHGSVTGMSTVPRAAYSTFGNWVQTAIELQASP